MTREENHARRWVDEPVSLPRDVIEYLVASMWDTATPDEIQRMTAIAMAESNGVVNAYQNNVLSGHQAEGSQYEHDNGLWQLNSVHGYDHTRLRRQPDYNFVSAVEVYEKQGFEAWSAFKSGASEAHMREVSSIPLALAIGVAAREHHFMPDDNPMPMGAIRVIPLAREGAKHRYLVEVIEDGG